MKTKKNKGRRRMYLRKKKDRFVIEQKVDGRIKHLCYVPHVEELYEILLTHREMEKAQNEAEKKASSTQEEGDVGNQKFAQPILGELSGGEK